MLLTNSQIHIYHTVVAQGGFAPAAKLLGLDPSTVSKTISRIEEELKLRLVERSSRAFAITQEGTILAQACADALQTMRGALSEISAMNSQIGGRLRVFVSAAIAEHRIAPLIPGFHQRHPDLSVEFVISNGYIDPIEEGVDLTLSHEMPTRDDLVMRRIGETAMALVATPTFLDSYGRPDRLEDIAHMPCIGASREMFNSWHFLQGAEVKQLTVRGPFRASTGSMMRRLALQGMGLALLSEAGVEAPLRHGKLERLYPGEARPKPLPLYAVYHDRRLLSGRIRAFVDYVSAHM